LFKVLTTVSVVGIPPTLMAGIYGMNFKFMLELNWDMGLCVWARSYRAERPNSRDLVQMARLVLKAIGNFPLQRRVRVYDRTVSGSCVAAAGSGGGLVAQPLKSNGAPPDGASCFADRVLLASRCPMFERPPAACYVPAANSAVLRSREGDGATVGEC
jgi:hypothetical protein